MQEVGFAPVEEEPNGDKAKGVIKLVADANFEGIEGFGRKCCLEGMGAECAEHDCCHRSEAA